MVVVAVAREVFLLWQAALEMLLLSRAHVFVGKFSSGLFRAAYAIAAARAGALPPYISLDASWCSDYAVRAGVNERFPFRTARAGAELEQIPMPDELPADGVARETGHRPRLLDPFANVFPC